MHLFSISVGLRKESINLVPRCYASDQDDIGLMKFGKPLEMFSNQEFGRIFVVNDWEWTRQRVQDQCVYDVYGMMSIPVEAIAAYDSLSDDKELIDTYERLTTLNGKRMFPLAAAGSHKKEVGILRSGSHFMTELLYVNAEIESSSVFGSSLSCGGQKCSFSTRYSWPYDAGSIQRQKYVATVDLQEIDCKKWIICRFKPNNGLDDGVMKQDGAKAQFMLMGQNGMGLDNLIQYLFN
ncbi:exocyst complex component SEC6 [Tanacetum coccineum]